MIKRYDMTRSDNFPVNTMGQMSCSGSGRFFVYTGFPVSSAILTPVSLPEGASLYVDFSSFGKDGFDVIYENVPEEAGGVEYSYAVT